MLMFPPVDWTRIDYNHDTVQLAATDQALYKLHASGQVWKYTGYNSSTS